MEISHKIDFVFWLGTCLMVSLVLAFVILALTYQNHFFKMKRNESDLLLKTSLKSERKERQRIAADMHDSILSDLNAVKVYLAIVKKEGIANCYDELKEGVEQAIESTRLISCKLMPPLLESQGLAASVTDYVQKLSLKTNVLFKVTGENPIRISVAEKYELFRILQEMTTNMIKHGKPRNCEISFNSNAEYIAINLKDDGLPFHFNAALQTSEGSGLKNIASRLRMIKGVLERKETELGNHYSISIKI